LLETQAARAGVKLTVAWEISSVPAILALVRNGHGHAVLTREALGDASDAAALVARPLADPELAHTLFLATSATKRVTPLQRSVMLWLRQHLSFVEAPDNKAKGKMRSPAAAGLAPDSGAR
jgi:LysR family nitrogen assimilation transcriptional regulator